MVLLSLHPESHVLLHPPCTVQQLILQVSNNGRLQWKDEQSCTQSYIHNQPQALGCCCPPHVVTPLRLEGMEDDPVESAVV